jgi:cell division protein FtsI (penicillin-binding protein 3)
MGRAPIIRSRSGWVYAALCLGAAVLAGRLAVLQVWDAPKLAAMAREQRTRAIDLATIRGEIVDREGQELAVSVNSWSVYAQPSEFEDEPAAIAAKLAPVLGLPPQELEQKLSGRHWRWISRQFDDKAIAQAVRELRLPGIGVLREKKRVYPKDSLAANLIGFVGIDNQGLAGIELDFEDVLRGDAEKLLIQVDARGRELLREKAGSPLESVLTDGAKIVLTLDERIQHVAERELAASITKHQAKRGAVLVMDPSNGDLLAFATHPTYDPNRYRDADWQTIKNWAAKDTYEPGSTMKMFTIAAALELNRIRPGEIFACGPTMTIGKYTISDHDAPAGIRRLSTEQIMEVSSNVGSIMIAERMSPQEHRDALLRFGFGRDTDSGIKGEGRGRLPKLPWGQITQASLSYGYSLSVTPLQILTAAASLANGGSYHAPRIIQRILSPEGDVIREFPPAPPRQAVSPETARKMLAIMRHVVDTGTGASAGIPGYNVAGKTGTANKAKEGGGGYSRDVMSSFIGFVPAEQPRIVVLALLDSPQNGHYASQTASPLFKAVAADTLRVLGVVPKPQGEAPLAGGSQRSGTRKGEAREARIDAHAEAIHATR